MAALEGHCGQTDDAMCSDHERTEALFKKLADETRQDGCALPSNSLSATRFLFILSKLVQFGIYLE